MCLRSLFLVEAWPSEKNAAGANFLTRFKICGGPTVSDWGRGITASRFNSFVLCCYAKCSQFDSRLLV